MKNKFLLLLSVIFLVSCGGYTTEEIEIESIGTVLESLSETYNVSSTDIKVIDYTLVQESDNVYTGILKTEYYDVTETWDVKVVWDHNTDKHTVEWKLKS